MRVIPFEPQYEDAVVDLIVSIQTEEFGIEITAEQQPDLRTIPSFYQTGTGNFWLAIADGQVVGTISLLDIGSAQAALRKMFVRRSFRGSAHGTAQALLRALLVWAERHAIVDIFLGTTPFFLAAHRFYEKHGFDEIPVHELPASFPIMEVDTRFYRYRTPYHGAPEDVDRHER